jgi:ABC-type branched-subunit amino acid transport system substrate-binding protein
MYITDASGNQNANVFVDEEFDAAVKAANARGGINGHPIKLVTCDSQTSNNGAQACGQQAASAHPFAIISYSGEDTFFPYAQAGRIPVLNEGSTALSFANPMSFVINDGLLDASAGYISVLKRAGCTSADGILTVVGNSTAALNALSGSMSQEAKLVGLTFKGLISAPLSAPDMTPFATEAADKNVQCVIPLAFGPQAVTLLKSLDTLVQEGKFKTVGICTCLVTPQVAAAEAAPIAALGKAGDLILAIESPQDTANAAVKEWVTDETTYGPAHPYLEYEGGTQWAELQLAIKAAEAVYPNVTAPNVLNWLDHQSDYWPGVSPPVDFTRSVPNNPFGPRVFGAWVTPTSWAGGTYWPRTQPFISVLTGQLNDNKGPSCPCG